MSKKTQMISLAISILMVSSSAFILTGAFASENDAEGGGALGAVPWYASADKWIDDGWIPISSVSDFARIGGGTALSDFDGEAYDFTWSSKYFMTNKIDEFGDHTPIGTPDDPFEGEFAGDDWTISGMNVNVTGSASVYGGLFGYIKNATITGVIIENSVVAAATTSASSSTYIVCAGGIAGYAENSIIEGCEFLGSGSVTASVPTGTSSSMPFAGGIIGNAYEYVTVELCYNEGSVTAEGSREWQAAGGIVGNSLSDLVIKNSDNAGPITTYGPDGSPGGIAGAIGDDSVIEACDNTGPITAMTYLGGSDLYAGGIVGSTMNGSDSVITKCYNTGAVNVMATGGAWAGGMVGWAPHSLNIYESCNLGAVYAESNDSVYVGGIIGFIEQTSTKTVIEECYNIVSITAVASDSDQYTDMAAGGLVGRSYNGILEITRCYNAGPVKLITTDVVCDTGAGGLVGISFGSSSQMTITDCYNTGSVEADLGGEVKGADGAGGIIGGVTKATIKNCYNRGYITADIAGAIVGRAYNGCDVKMIRCFFLAGTVPADRFVGFVPSSGTLTADGLAAINSAYISGKKTADQMRPGTTDAEKIAAAQVSVSSSIYGWDLSSWGVADTWDFRALAAGGVWTFTDPLNEGYPVLHYPAHVELPTYTVTVTNGSATPGSGMTGATVTLAPETAPVGQQFKEWNITPAGSWSLSGNIFTIGAENVTVTAIWEAIPTHTVTVTGGSATPGSGATGSTVALSYGTAPAGQQFKEWDVIDAGGGSLSGNTFTIGTANATIEAVWEAIPTYTVTVTGGSASPTSGVTGAAVTLTPGTAPDGQKFKEWNVTTSGGGTLSGNTFTIGTANVSITAVWEDVETDDLMSGTDDGGSDWWLWILLIVAIAVIASLLLFFFFFVKKKKDDEEDEKQKP